MAESSGTRDFRKEVTSEFIRLLERGESPWQRSWNPDQPTIRTPVNPTAGKEYRSGNAINLIASAFNKGFDDPRWLTAKQASENGWKVRDGQAASYVEFWEVNYNSPKQRIFPVFNAQQIDGVPPAATVQVDRSAAAKIAEQIVKMSGAKVVNDQTDRSYYTRKDDSIHLPPRDSFATEAGYFGAAIHELTHWSGHPSRLDRPSLNEFKRVGDINFAREELRAELASVFIAASKGIPNAHATGDDRSSTTAAIIYLLKKDKHELFRAAYDASLAAEFVLSFNRDVSVAESDLVAEPGRGPESLKDEEGVLERDSEKAAEVETAAANPQHDVAPSTQFDLTYDSARYDALFSLGCYLDDETPTEQREFFAEALKTEYERLRSAGGDRLSAWAEAAKIVTDQNPTIPVHFIRAANDPKGAAGTTRVPTNGKTAEQVVVEAWKVFQEDQDALGPRPGQGDYLVHDRDVYKITRAGSVSIGFQRQPELDALIPHLGNKAPNRSSVEASSVVPEQQSAGVAAGHPNGQRIQDAAANVLSRWLHQLGNKLDPTGNESHGPRETSEVAVRTQPSSGSIAVEQKSTGDSRRSLAPVSAPVEGKLFQAEIRSGTYGGLVRSASTEGVLQEIAPNIFVSHPSAALNRQPQVGEWLRINYRDGKGVVGPFEEKKKERALAR